jgi:AcrR family transcriptional regulator
LAPAATASEVERRLRAIPAPRPMLSRSDLDGLTERQREILQELGALFAAGFAHLTMSELAARLGCSLRTLYGLAPSRDELVLTVVDLHLWRIGREAMAAISPDMAPLDAVRAYLSAATVAVSRTTEAYARDLAATPPAQRRNGDHADYVVAVTRTLLDLAVEQGDIDDVDTAAVARTIANLGQDFIRPEVLPTLRSTPKVAADEVVDIVLRGLPRPRGRSRPGDPPAP